uniref:Cation/H+ exchanger domain-containing protein n=1 Tax=Oryza barthii TaxID=65489 RepID=A0A0D3H163_9ORYZ
MVGVHRRGALLLHAVQGGHHAGADAQHPGHREGGRHQQLGGHDEGDGGALLDGSTLTLSMVVITAVATPLIKLLYDPSGRFARAKRRTMEGSRPNAELRVMACLFSEDHAAPLLNLIEESGSSRDAPMSLIVLHLTVLVGHATSVLKPHRKSRSSCGNPTPLPTSSPSSTSSIPSLAASPSTPHSSPRRWSCSWCCASPARWWGRRGALRGTRPGSRPHLPPRFSQDRRIATSLLRLFLQQQIDRMG